MRIAGLGQPVTAFLLSGLAWVTCRANEEEARHRMVQDQIVARGVTERRVLLALEKVPRHEFVPRQFRRLAYTDRPLPIGEGQTISQPYIVAYMTAALALQPGEKVLEIGTGSGYQAAVLAEITTNVFTIEIVEPLARSAEERLRRLGYRTVQVKCGDGYHGWPEHAPFDAIIVTCAAEPIPPALIEQLKSGGRMIIPRGKPFSEQWLVLVTKDAVGQVTTEPVLPVAFVPMTRPRH